MQVAAMGSFKLSLLKRTCLYVVSLVYFTCCLISCEEESKNEFMAEQDELQSLTLALDSVEVLYQDPGAEKIIQGAFKRVVSDPEHPLLIRTLRLSSTVLLSKLFPSSAALDSAVSFAWEGKKLALRKNDSIEWAMNEIQIGRYYVLRNYWLGENDGLKKATPFLHRAIDFLESHKLTVGLSFAYHWLAIAVPVSKYEMKKQLLYKLKALAYNDSARYPNLRAKICNDLSAIYADLANDPKKSKEMLFRSIRILEKLNDKYSLSVALGNLAALFSQEGDYKQGLFYFKQAEKIAREEQLWQRESSVCHQLAKHFQADRMFDSAIFYSRKSIDILKAHAVPGSELFSWRGEIARSYIKTGNRKFALRLMNVLESEFSGTQVGYEDMRTAFFRLSDLAAAYEALGDLKKLTETQHRLLQLGDTLFSPDHFIEVVSVVNQYQLKLKNKELEVLQLSLYRQFENATREKHIRFLLLGCILIAVLGLAILGKVLKQTRRFNKTLLERTGVIEKQSTDLENSLKALHHAQAHMLTSEKMVMLGQFTAGVAHELNNPLNFISGGASILDELTSRFLSDSEMTDTEVFETITELKTVLTNINSGVDRMTTIVGSLQIFSNPAEIPAHESDADVSECLNASLILIKSKLERESVQVIRNYKSVKVQGHSGRISQVFINLIDNAIDALLGTDVRNRQLTINTSISRKEVSITFQDNGAGIPRNIRSDIFNAFFTTKETGQGTGLGLFICYNIVKDAGGTISVESERGTGSIFTVRLPHSKF